MSHSFWIQIIVIAVLLLFFYKKFIENTASAKVVHGLLGLGGLWILSFIMGWLHLGVFENFLRWVALFLSVGLVVIFQPELRKFLTLMGNVRLFRFVFVPKSVHKAVEEYKLKHEIEEIVKAVEYMSDRHTGALIVFKSPDDDDTIEKTGVRLDAEISCELLLTIFFNKTPLHDGAVIIGDDRIISAGAILPLSKKTGLSWKYGTRHRAALGMSEVSNSVVLIVSEETGDVSVVEKGVIKKYEDMKKVKLRLSKSFK